MELPAISTTDVATVAATFVTLISLSIGLVEYRRRGVMQRAQQFMMMRRRLKENPTFKRICAFLETDDSKLEEIPFADKRDFLGLFEEVALMMRSKLIRKEVAHYMFGYYAIRCWESNHFWITVNRNSPYWEVFKDFVKEMKHIEESSNRFETRNLRF